MNVVDISARSLLLVGLVSVLTFIGCRLVFAPAPQVARVGQPTSGERSTSLVTNASLFQATAAAWNSHSALLKGTVPSKMFQEGSSSRATGGLSALGVDNKTLPSNIFQQGSRGMDRIGLCETINSTGTTRQENGNNSVIPVYYGQRTIIERAFSSSVSVEGRGRVNNPLYVLSHVCFKDGQGALGAHLVDNTKQFVLPTSWAKQCKVLRPGDRAPRKFCYRDDANIAFAAELHENTRHPPCYTNAVAVVQLWNPDFNVLNYNMYHLSLKIQSLMAAVDRMEKEYTATQVAVLLQTGTITKRRLRKQVAPLMEFMLPVVADKYFGVRKIPAGYRLDNSSDQGDQQQRCFRWAYFGFDSAHSVTEATSSGHMQVARRLRRRVAKKYPELGLRFGRTKIVQPTQSTSLLRSPRLGLSCVEGAKPRVISVLVATRKDVSRRILRGAGRLANLASVFLNDYLRDVMARRPDDLCGNITVEVLTVSLGLLSVKEQARLAAATDIFVAVHGMALAWTMMMPPGSVVVELSNYYRFGRNNGLNINCHTIYGGYVSRFEHHHLLYFKPHPTKKLEESGKIDVRGGRNYDVSINPKPWQALMEGALCVWLLSPTDTSEDQPLGSDSDLTDRCRINEIPNESKLQMTAIRKRERCFKPLPLPANRTGVRGENRRR